MKEHPHATVLRALADGVPLSEFEILLADSTGFVQLAGMRSHDWIWKDPSEWTIRRKPQHIMVNGFKVPSPLDAYKSDDYFIADVSDELFYSACTNRGDMDDQTWLDRGISHSTKEAAIAHAKAMLGIDPQFLDPNAT